MKKFLSILLAVILAFSAFTMVSFAEDAENTEITEGTTETPTETPDEPVETPEAPAESMLAKWMDEVFNNNFANSNIALEIDSEIYRDTDFGSMTVTNVYSKDGKVAIDASFKLSFLNIKIKCIFDFNNETLSFYLPDFPLFYITVPALSDTFNGFLDSFYTDTSDLIVEKSQYVKIDGTEYYVEEYFDGDLHVYFKDGKLVRAENSYRMIIMDVSYDVSDKDVSVPSLALNVTPLVILFGLFGLI